MSHYECKRCGQMPNHCECRAMTTTDSVERIAEEMERWRWTPRETPSVMMREWATRLRALPAHGGEVRVPEESTDTEAPEYFDGYEAAAWASGRNSMRVEVLRLNAAAAPGCGEPDSSSVEAGR